jgi:PHS family inorganic phosphate transporter-like MFS transporter
MLGIVYRHDQNGALSTQQDTAIKLATSAGTVIGQVGFGALADIVGRKKMYGLELVCRPLLLDSRNSPNAPI